MPRIRRPAPTHRLETALARLPRPTREIFLAHRLDGLPCSEIARRTGLPAREVRRHLARALRAVDRAVNGRPRRWSVLRGW